MLWGLITLSMIMLNHLISLSAQVLLVLTLDFGLGPGLDNFWISHLMFWGWPRLTSCSPDNAPICLPTLAVTELRLRPPTPRPPIVTPLTSEVAASLLEICHDEHSVQEKTLISVQRPTTPLLKQLFWQEGQFSNPQVLFRPTEDLKNAPTVPNSCFYTSVIGLEN